MRLIVGLGNPGAAYAETRHNVGFWVLDALAAKVGGRFRRSGSLTKLQGRWGEHEVTLAKPQTFMNRSGLPVADLVKDLDLELSHLIVVHDDLDLQAGRLRLKAHGGAGGHQGVHSIIQALATDRFARLKIGIGRPPAGADAADYVLTPVLEAERQPLDQAVEQAALALECWVTEGLMVAMNRFNRPITT